MLFMIELYISFGLALPAGNTFNRVQRVISKGGQLPGNIISLPQIGFTKVKNMPDPDIGIIYFIKFSP